MTPWDDRVIMDESFCGYMTLPLLSIDLMIFDRTLAVQNN